MAKLKECEQWWCVNDRVKLKDLDSGGIVLTGQNCRAVGNVGIILNSEN
jgi:hypothetical protein